MRTIRTAKKRAAFLAALQSGYSATGACDQAGIGKTAAYAWRNDEPEFAAEWDEAVDGGTDVLEDEARRRAVEGTDKPIYQGGSKVGVVREYSDTLLIFLLKGRRPEKFKDRVQQQHTGKDGEPLTFTMTLDKAGDDDDSDG